MAIALWMWLSVICETVSTLPSRQVQMVSCMSLLQSWVSVRVDHQPDLDVQPARYVVGIEEGVGLVFDRPHLGLHGGLHQIDEGQPLARRHVLPGLVHTREPLP